MAYYTPTPLDYQAASTRAGLPVCNGLVTSPLSHTSLLLQPADDPLTGRPELTVQLIYVSTPVLIWWPSGVVSVNNGGWRTSTTRARINQFSPYALSVYRFRGHQWLEWEGQTYGWGSTTIHCVPGSGVRNCHAQHVANVT